MRKCYETLVCSCHVKPLYVDLYYFECRHILAREWTKGETVKQQSVECYWNEAWEIFTRLLLPEFSYRTSFCNNYVIDAVADNSFVGNSLFLSVCNYILNIQLPVKFFARCVHTCRYNMWSKGEKHEIAVRCIICSLYYTWILQ